METGRDKFTDGILSNYARKVFFGDISINAVPADLLESVKKELDENGLSYLYEEESEEDSTDES